MTTMERPAALGSYNDPYNAHGHPDSYANNTPHHAGLGLQHPASNKRASVQSATQLPSTKALAITSRITRGASPPPLMGSAIVLVNDSALHCFGGRLEDRELTNCHYVLDVETGYWMTIQAAGDNANSNGNSNSNTDTGTSDSRALFSLSLSTDPVNTNSGSLSIQPCPRYFHTLNAYGTSLILFGGMGSAQVQQNGEDSDNEGDQPGKLAALDDLHVFDIVTQRWQQKHPRVNEHTPRARWAHMATILDHYLIVIGGTDTVKAYVEDACILDLHTWEWVASVRNIGQCGSYRTIAATGPSVQASNESMPSSHSFPSVNASSPQISSSLSWSTTESGSIDAMANLSMVLSGRISVPSSTTSSRSIKTSTAKETTDSEQDSIKKTSVRLKSGELTPAFNAGTDMPSIYLYSNYNFQNLQREFKVIAPQYSPSLASSTPSFTLIDRSQALERTGYELPPGLRFPQGHVYQNQLILTGTLIVPGKAPTLAIYSFSLSLNRWEKLDTDTSLLTGSWNRTILHPATGTLLIFGNRESNAEIDYSTRIQHHHHLMMINLQAYGLYERPVPSFLRIAQDLGEDLLRETGLSDMHLASATGTLFDANSTILAGRWPEFATMLLSPPYVTPLILVLPVPDEVIPVFLHYLYTGALPQNALITPGIADYLLILARRYQLNGLHALTLDVLHQAVITNPMRVYNSALMAGELGLQARAVGLAMFANRAAQSGQDQPPPLPPAPRKRVSVQAYVLENGLSRNYSTRVPPPSSRPPVTPERRHRGPPSHHSRDSVSTDGGNGGIGLVGETLLQQYSHSTIQQQQQQQQGTVYMSSPEPGAASRQQRAVWSPPTTSSFSSQQHHHHHPVSFLSTGSGGSGSANDSPLASPVAHSRGQSYFQGYSSPLPPNAQTQGSYASHGAGYMRNGSEGVPSVYVQDDQDDGTSIHSSGGGRDMRAQQAKRRLQMQMQMHQELDQQHQQLQQQHQRQQEEYARQLMLIEQQQARDEELAMQQQQQQQHQQRFLQKQQPLQHNPAVMMGALDYHMGGTPSNVSTKSSGSKSNGKNYASSMMTVTTESTVESHKSGSSGGKAMSVKSTGSEEKKKGLLAKMKPPKPKASGADLMKSAGF